MEEVANYLFGVESQLFFSPGNGFGLPSRCLIAFRRLLKKNGGPRSIPARFFFIPSLLVVSGLAELEGLSAFLFIL